jgi:hypothetical protein
MEVQEASWSKTYRAGAVAALIALLVGVIEIGVTFLPGGTGEGVTTTVDWFKLLQDDWFMGLRNLGLLNLLLTAATIPIFLALFAAHRRKQPAGGACALIVATIGIAVFYATNRALPMLALSHQYESATSDAQRAGIEAAGTAMLAVGQSHGPGTFLGFVILDIAFLLISLVLLRGAVFGKATAWVGLIGFGFLLVFEVLSSLAPAFSDVAMVLAMIGGVLGLIWYGLIARRLSRLGIDSRAAS